MNDYLDSINPKKSNDVIDSILEQAKELNTPIIQSDAINLLIQLIQTSKVQSVLEIGSAIAYSAIMMATFTNCKVFTIERDLDSYKRAIENIKKAKLEDRITIVHADALEYPMTEDYQFDLLFIDAAKAQYIKFFEKYEIFLKPNGIVVSDNLLFHGLVGHKELIESRNVKQLVRKIDGFNDYIINNPKYDTYIYNIGDGLSISIKK
ncbi:MAG: O-methyltransferase [Tenericutes bacterium]|nr:O-methyltransferase [Mycoplasmatota bacterium]